MATHDIPATVVSLSANTYGTIVGGSAAVSTNDGDTTHVRIAKPDTGSSFTGYQFRVNFPATNIPGDLESTSLVTVTKGEQSPNLTTLNLTREVPGGRAAYFWNPVVALPSVDWVEQVTPLQAAELLTEPTSVKGGPGVEVVTQEMIEAGDVEYNPGYALINDSASGAGWTTWFTYVALRITYTDTAVPPQRVYPRDDGLIGGTAPRVWPPSKSRQRGNRIDGGYL